MASHALWAHQGTYPMRQGNGIKILIDGQAAYSEISAAFRSASKFIYLTISYGTTDFLPVPESGETIFDILRVRQRDGVDVRMVVWEPALKTADTIPDTAHTKIKGVNEGAGSIQARWDRANGYRGWYKSPRGHFLPWLVEFPSQLGCHHQKTYIMDDGQGGIVAFVGGINPVQSYWDTPEHDSLDARRVELGKDPLETLEKIPPLHDIFYKIEGPAVADVFANFVERYNGASIPFKDVTSDAELFITADQVAQVPGGIDLQVVRTIAPKTYPATRGGDQGIRELYFNMLGAARAGDLVYIENQYFFDHGVVSEIHEAAERGALIIVVLTSEPDEGTIQGRVESMLEKISGYEEIFSLVSGHSNVGLFTLGNSRPDPRAGGKTINSETYVHSKNMAVIGDQWAIMMGGSANIAFTSMWFHSEMNIAFSDPALIKSWVAGLWSEHLRISPESATELIEKPEEALNFFKEQATADQAAMEEGRMPDGRIYKMGTRFPARRLEGIDLGHVLPASEP